VFEYLQRPWPVNTKQEIVFQENKQNHMISYFVSSLTVHDKQSYMTCQQTIQFLDEKNFHEELYNLPYFAVFSSACNSAGAMI